MLFQHIALVDGQRKVILNARAPSFLPQNNCVGNCVATATLYTAVLLDSAYQRCVNAVAPLG